MRYFFSLIIKQFYYKSQSADIVVTFEQPSYTFIENELVGSIRVRRIGGASDRVFQVSVMGGPSVQQNIERSTDGIDTFITFGSLPDFRDIVFDITDDDVALETTERYNVELILPPGSTGVSIGEFGATTINIIDDDGRCIYNSNVH